MYNAMQNEERQRRARERAERARQRQENQEQSRAELERKREEARARGEVYRPELGDYDEGRWQRNRRAYERGLNEYEAELLEQLEDRMPTAEEMSYEAALEEGDFSLGPSAAGQAMADQGAIDAQRRALGQLEDVYRQGGYTDAERMQIEQAQQQARAQERAGVMAARQQAAARGMVGSGAQMAAQMAAQQGAMNRGRAAATDIALQGQQRALRALEGAGRTAGEMRGQSFEEGFKRGSAIDDFAQSDMDYRRDKEMRRADRETDARKRRGEAEQLSYENLAQNRRDRVSQSQSGRQALTATESRIDDNTQKKWDAFAGAVEGTATAVAGL